MKIVSKFNLFTFYAFREISRQRASRPNQFGSGGAGQGLLLYRWTTHWFQQSTLEVSLLVYWRNFLSFFYNPRVLECWNFYCGFGPPFCMGLFQFFEIGALSPPLGGLKTPPKVPAFWTSSYRADRFWCEFSNTIIRIYKIAELNFF